MVHDLYQPEPFHRPDLPATHPSPDLIGSIQELGGWYTRPSPRPVPKGALRTYSDYLAHSMRLFGTKMDRGVLDALVDLVPRRNPGHPPVDLTCKIGDTVKIMETRPLSKKKCWRVVEIVERAK